tara:strand:+ start:2023 stop:2733 length:711 start_codon:yes stop_codon:yes gene_type:complete
MKIISFIILLLLTNVLLGNDNFKEGNDFYNNGKYFEAIKIYKKEVKKGLINSKIYFNIGNSYFRLGELGKAIFYYRLAERENPRDGDIKYNLNFAREKVKDKIDISGFNIWSKLFPFSFSESLWGLFLFSILFWPIFIITQFKKVYSFTIIRNTLFFIMILLSLNVVILNFSHSRFGVAINSEVSVFSGIGKDNIVLFSLKEGAEFRVKNIKNDTWAQIELNKDQRGWVQKREIIF